MRLMLLGSCVNLGSTNLWIDESFVNLSIDEVLGIDRPTFEADHKFSAFRLSNKFPLAMIHSGPDGSGLRSNLNKCTCVKQIIVFNYNLYLCYNSYASENLELALTCEFLCLPLRYNWCLLCKRGFYKVIESCRSNF
jgi:hypothetical protein